MSQQLIIATGNNHKVSEFAGLLAGLDFEVLSASVCGGMPEVEETGTTFAENALLKARALKALAPEGAWVLSDDSGLCVDVLKGAPGIYSARYAGPDATDQINLDKLLYVLKGIPLASRAARFRCVLALIAPDGEATTHEGACEGHIAGAASGASGFGYDPIFIPEGYQQSFAELGEAVKAKLSHRAKAVQALRHFLATRH